MSKNKSLKFLISRSFALLLIGFLFEVHGQVPVNDLPAAPAPSTGLVGAPEGFDDLGLGVLADPVELRLVDGLEEPLERLRLRDQDTNMILDMIQVLTDKYILRPQNLPQVKVNFDSFSILTKRETLNIP